MPNLGPKTGTFEPPHEQPLHKQPHLWNTMKEFEERITCKEKDIKSLIQLTCEIISAFEINDTKSLEFLLKEFSEIKKKYK
jgi:hypothetical protein